MPTIVTENCQDCRFTECVTVCPVACFHGDERMLYIDQSVCIDCKACIPMCPVSAILDADDLPEDKAHWFQINAERAPKLPRVDHKAAPLPTAEGRKLALGF